MNSEEKSLLLFRLIGVIVVFLVIFFGSGIFIPSPSYNIYIRAFEFFTAVVGAGLYWIGSKK